MQSRWNALQYSAITVIGESYEAHIREFSYLSVPVRWNELVYLLETYGLLYLLYVTDRIYSFFYSEEAIDRIPQIQKYIPSNHLNWNVVYKEIN